MREAAVVLGQASNDQRCACLLYTSTQVFDISELGLVEMTRKRVNEGLLESVSSVCTVCDGRGFVVETGL